MGNVILAALATYFVGIVALVVASPLVAYTLGYALLSAFPKQRDAWVYPLIQLVIFSLSASAGLLVGMFMVDSGARESILPWMIIPLALDAVSYAVGKTRIVTADPARQRRVKRVMGVAGAAIAYVVGFTVFVWA
jgi:hypothetical protein